MKSVVLSPYSASWPVAFAEAHDELTAAFAPVRVRIEHIGSTSVPGLSAKPVLDVLLGASSLEEIETGIEGLERIGYAYVAKYELELPERRYFVKQSLAGLRVHLHAVEFGGRLWADHLAFRDALRTDPSLRSRYQALKSELAATYSHDKTEYQSAKAPFIRSVLAGLP